MLSTRILLPDLDSYCIENIVRDDDDITIFLRRFGRTSHCPRCARQSRSIHSRYVRTLVHLPIAGGKVTLLLTSRRFRCHRRSCQQQIFTERIPELAGSYSRSTDAHQEAVRVIGVALGANPGKRCADALGIPTSATTIRRRICQSQDPRYPSVRVLGVDDWPWRKGDRYGTILCDLERGHIVDLLPDRTAQSLAQWLRAHRGVEIISRNRASCYSQGAREGAPEAVQVADRWHLLKNMGDVLES